MEVTCHRPSCLCAKRTNLFGRGLFIRSLMARSTYFSSLELPKSALSYAEIFIRLKKKKKKKNKKKRKNSQTITAIRKIKTCGQITQVTRSTVPPSGIIYLTDKIIFSVVPFTFPLCFCQEI